MEDARGIPCFYIMRSKLCIQKCPLKNMGLSGRAMQKEFHLLIVDRNSHIRKATFVPKQGTAAKP